MRPGKRLLGLAFDGRPIFEPRPTHSILYSAAGGGKTTCGVVPWLLSMLADPTRAIVLMDTKSGELEAQLAALCALFDRKTATVDDAGVRPGTPYRIDLSPFGGILAAHAKKSGDLVFATDNANHALIQEPSNDAKNQYFRDGPRSLIEFATLLLLKRTTHLTTPGGVWGVLADPETMKTMAKVEAEEGDGTLASLSRQVLELAEHNQEHWSMHHAAAMKALRSYCAESALHEAGLGATLTHVDLLREGYVVFVVGPIQHMARLSAHYSLHIQSFLEALYTGIDGKVDFILEEATNTPLKTLVTALTTMRGYGGSCHFVVQSRSELVRAFGEKETETIEENATVKQWFGLSSFAEAERLSKAMGEDRVIEQSLGLSSAQLDYSHTLSNSKEPIFSPERLMRLPAGEQILHVKDVGFIHARKIRQNQIAPYCHHLADNPLEGRRLPPEPLITLPTNKGGRR